MRISLDIEQAIMLIASLHALEVKLQCAVDNHRTYLARMSADKLEDSERRLKMIKDTKEELERELHYEQNVREVE